MVVAAVVRGSGAEQSGLVGLRQRVGAIELGDVILTAAGQPVSVLEDLLAIVEQFSIGDQVPLQVWRQGEVRQVNVPLTKELTA